MTGLMPGRVLGVAGGGLDDASSWAASAEVAAAGKAGEVATATILDSLALRPGGASVLHDVMIPIPGFRANIDHVVVAGSRVWLIDSKRWKPGFYWSLGEMGMRGMSRFKVPARGGGFAYPMEKKTMQMASERLAAHLRGAGRVAMSTVVVHPSRAGHSVSVWAASMPGASLVSVAKFERLARRFMKPGANTAANPAVVERLVPLLASMAGSRS